MDTSVLHVVLIFISVLVPVAQDPATDSNALTRLGIMAIRAGRPEEGIKSLDKAIEKDPQNSLAFYWRGRARTDQGNYKEAVADFDKVIQLDPEEPTAYIARANVRRKLEDEAGVKKDMDMATKLEPDYAKPHQEIKIGKDKNEQGKKLSLTDRLAKLMDLSEKDRLAEQYHQLGMAKLKLNDSKGALDYYNKAIQLNPDDAEAYLYRAVAKRNRKDYKGVVTDLNRAIQLNPDFVEAYVDRGTVKDHYLENPTGAIEDYDQALQRNPNHAWAFNSRGVAYMNLKDYRNAVVNFDQAIRIISDYTKAYNNRGLAKYVLRDYPGAVADLERAVQLDPALRAKLQPWIDKARAGK